MLTQAFVVLLPRPEDVWLIAIVSPELTPVTGPAAKAPPLMEIAVQSPPQVAVQLEKEPFSVTALLVIVVLMATSVWLVKLIRG